MWCPMMSIEERGGNARMAYESSQVKKLCFEHAIRYRQREGKGKRKNPPKAVVTEDKSECEACKKGKSIKN